MPEPQRALSKPLAVTPAQGGRCIGLGDGDLTRADGGLRARGGFGPHPGVGGSQPSFWLWHAAWWGEVQRYLGARMAETRRDYEAEGMRAG